MLWSKRTYNRGLTNWIKANLMHLGQMTKKLCIKLQRNLAHNIANIKQEKSQLNNFKHMLLTLLQSGYLGMNFDI